ncbi:protoglobin domain-containing protein [Photobacterium damselae]|uniref:protoglobin domain-containing protein n=1 Tax=Photobacterium damselae TaxID=38293 RepID=UPI002F429167
MDARNLIHQTLAEQLNINEHDIEQRKISLSFVEQDEVNLQQCLKWLEPLLPQVVQEFYQHQVSIPEIALIIGDKDTLKRLHYSMSQYITELFSGSYDMDYVAKRLQIGRIHQRIGVTPKLYLSGINRLQHLLEDIIRDYSEDELQTNQILSSLKKLMYFDNQLVFDTYISTLQSEVIVANKQLESYANNLEQIVSDRTQRLEELADSMRETLRKSDSAARHGGDEFCIWLPNTALKKTQILVERLCRHFDQHKSHDVSLSIGVTSVYPEHYLPFEKLLIEADELMYQAKKIAHQTHKNEVMYHQDLSTVTMLQSAG